MKTLYPVHAFFVLALCMSCSGGGNDVTAQNQFHGSDAFHPQGVEALSPKNESHNGQVLLRDPQLNNMPAVHLHLPKGYAMQGGIQWEQQNNLFVPVTRAAIKHPEKNASLTTLPVPMKQYIHSQSMINSQREAQQYGIDVGGQFRQDPVLPAEQAMAALLLPVVQNLRGGVYNTIYEVIPDLNAQLWPGQNKHNTPTTGLKMTVNYKQGGMEMKEEIYGLYYQLRQQSADGFFVMWGLDRTFGIAAPVAQFGALQPELLAIASSFKNDPAYDKAVELEFQRQIQKSNERHDALQRQSAAQHQERMANQRASFEASQQAYRETQNAYSQQNQAWAQNQESLFRSNQNVNDNIVGYQRYTDPNTGHEKLLDNQYNQQWTDNWGNTHGSNDVNYNPNHYNTGNQYYQMQPVR